MPRFLKIIALLLLAQNACAQIYTLNQKIDSIMFRMTLWDKLFQLYPYDVMNTGDDPRLGIPGFYMADGPHGFRYPASTGGMTYPVPPEAMATSFPVSMAVAATWDTDVALRLGMAMGNEFSAKGVNQALAPALYLCNDPRNGRSAESFGEDPYLCASIGYSFVKGIQSTPSVATLKSFLCENGQDSRMTDTISISKRMLMEHWGWPFKECIQQSNASSVMSAYVAVNGTAASQNHILNTHILRNEWGFPYYLVSDWGSVRDAVPSLTSGLDVCMGSDKYAAGLWPSLLSGTLSDSVLDLSVRRVLKNKLLSGIIGWQPQVKDTAVNGNFSQSINYEAAVKSMVLLKNQSGILPLDVNGNISVALIGPSSGVAQLDGYGSSYVFPTYTVSPLQAMISRIGFSRVNYAAGCGINSNDTSGFMMALQQAAVSDVVIYVGGLDASQEGETLDRVSGSVELPGVQQELIHRLSTVNPNVIAVILSGGVVSLSNCIHNIKGLIYGFYPGQEQGNAIADIVFGMFNPGGKLPVTMPSGDAQLPERNNNFNDDWGGGYRWFDKQGLIPAFPFGFGLSYTTFSLDSLWVVSDNIPAGSDMDVRVKITNTGLYEGDEVIQLYVEHPSGLLPMPLKQLKAFKRVHLRAGQSLVQQFTISPENLYVYNESTGSYELLTGTYRIMAGNSSASLDLSANITVHDANPEPDLVPADILIYPPYPRVGDTVIFLVNIRNKGIAPLLDTELKGKVMADGNDVAETDTTVSIPMGGMVQADAGKGFAGKNWWVPASAGYHTISFQIDNQNLISETNEYNNELQKLIRVYDTVRDPLDINLAWRKPASSSSVSDISRFSPAYAVDGLRNSRWESDSSDFQFFQVDLLSNYLLSLIKIRWADGYANKYLLLSSTDEINWDTLASIQFGNGNSDEFTPGRVCRYIRIVTLSGGTSGPYSVYELQAFGAGAYSEINDQFKVVDDHVIVSPNPCRAGENVRILSEKGITYRVDLISMQGEIIAGISTKNGDECARISNGLNPGVYFLKIYRQGKDRVYYRKLVIIR